MGNQQASKQATTKVTCKLDRNCFQSGSFLKGSINIEIADSDKATFQKFNQGALVELKIFGEEYVHWAKGHKHNAKRREVYANKIQAKDQWEAADILHESTHQIPITIMELQTKSKFTVPFSLPLPSDLPSSLFFCGPDLSIFKIQYALDISFIGLEGAIGPVPQATLIYKENKIFKVRKVDAKIEKNVCKQEEGKLSATFGNNGSASIQVSIPSDTFYQSQPMPIGMMINNRQSKVALDCIKVQILRTISGTARGIDGQQSKTTITTAVLRDKIENAAVAGCSNPVPIQSQLPLTYDNQQRICSDDSRGIYVCDIKTGCELPIELRSMQHDFVPTTDTKLIKCDYVLEVQLFHKGTFKKFSEVPIVKIPLKISRNPEGPIEQVVNIAASNRQSQIQAQALPESQILVDTHQMSQQAMFSYDYSDAPGMPIMGAPMGESLDLPPMPFDPNQGGPQYYPELGPGPPMAGMPIMGGPPMGGPPMGGPPMGGAPMLPPGMDAIQGEVMDNQPIAKY